MSNDRHLEARCLGSLLGCAIGDALGAPYEGLWRDAIPDKETLLSDYEEFIGYPKGQFTDDTQMTLASIQAMVEEKESSPAHIADRMSRLWKSQAIVGPGGACMEAMDDFLESGDWKTCGAPAGQAGNGTAMRTTVLGLYYIYQPKKLSEEIAAISKITHRDPRSLAGGIATARACQLLALEPSMDFGELCFLVAAPMKHYSPNFADLVENLPQKITSDFLTTFEEIAWSGMIEPEHDRPIITPFVIPTVLASLWAVGKFPNNWSKAVHFAISLGGDTDTLGAIVGALMGSKLGFGSLPKHLVERICQKDELKFWALRFSNLIQELK